MAKKLCVIAVWYGKLPEYFRFWERSCGENDRFADFLLVTDQNYKPAFSNIHVCNCSIEELRGKISRKLGFAVSLEKAFKICDFRPAYGVIFDEELKGYAYWGHCDLDQVFGDLGMLVNRTDFDNYDKIGRSGHLTLYRNCEKVNELFRQDGALYGYRTVFENPTNYAFDERTGICRIAKAQGTSYLNIVGMRADIRVRTRRLEINAAKNYEKQLFYWENGSLYRAFMEDGQIHAEPFIYIHFQKKKLRDFCEKMPEAFFIGREGFYEKTGEVCEADFDRYNHSDSGIARAKDTAGYYWKKTKDYLNSDKAQKQVWMAQKKIGNEQYD